MKFSLPPLPYALDALGELMPAHTLEYHYGRHHAAYINNLNALIEGTEFEKYETLEDIMLRASGAIFNNAAQAWNHHFFFDQFSPTPQNEPHGPLRAAIDRDFGSFATFKEKFEKATLSLFGSGWVWLVIDSDGILSIDSTSNAGNPATEEGLRPIMTIDVWEHSYYLDHQNRRADYLANFWKLIDWAVITRRF